MKVYALIRQPYRLGWGVMDTLKQPTLTVSIQRTGWVGDASLESTHQYPLGTELQLLNADNHETLWLGKIVERRYRSTDKRWQYKLRGICEHFLDLPFPYPEHTFEHTRTPNAWIYWERHLKEHLWRHTPRYRPVYQLSLLSFPTSALAFRTARDAFKLYQSLRPCKITPNLLPDGAIEMILEDLPLTPYPLPKNAHYELTESILETATRISLTEPAKQILKDRRLANSEFWDFIVPPGTSINASIQDFQTSGYLGPYATRLFVVANPPLWVGIRYREPIKTPKDAAGQRAPVVVGFRARGSNALVRINIDGTPSAPQSLTPNTYTDIAYSVTPISDVFTLTIEIQRITPPLSAEVIIDALYCIPFASTPLNERDYPPHLAITDQIPSFLTGGTVARIADVIPFTGGYQIQTDWNAFPSTIPSGTTVQILQKTGYLSGTVVSVVAPNAIRIAMPATPAPQPGDILYLAHGPAPNSELQYDTLYTQLDTPAAPTTANLGHLIEQIASPSITLTAQFPLAQGAPLPQIGQLALCGAHPEIPPLPIYEIELPITNGHLNAVQIRAGTPELTMRALLRRLTPTRTRTP